MVDLPLNEHNSQKSIKQKKKKSKKQVFSKIKENEIQKKNKKKPQFNFQKKYQPKEDLNIYKTKEKKQKNKDKSAKIHRKISSFKTKKPVKPKVITRPTKKQKTKKRQTILKGNKHSFSSKTSSKTKVMTNNIVSTSTNKSKRMRKLSQTNDSMRKTKKMPNKLSIDHSSLSQFKVDNFIPSTPESFTEKPPNQNNKKTKSQNVSLIHNYINTRSFKKKSTYKSPTPSTLTNKKYKKNASRSPNLYRSNKQKKFFTGNIRVSPSPSKKKKPNLEPEVQTRSQLLNTVKTQPSNISDTQTPKHPKSNLNLLLSSSKSEKFTENPDFFNFRSKKALLLSGKSNALSMTSSCVQNIVSRTIDRPLLPFQRPNRKLQKSSVKMPLRGQSSPKRTLYSKKQKKARTSNQGEKSRKRSVSRSRSTKLEAKSKKTYLQKYKDKKSGNLTKRGKREGKIIFFLFGFFVLLWDYGFFVF